MTQSTIGVRKAFEVVMQAVDGSPSGLEPNGKDDIRVGDLLRAGLTSGKLGLLIRNGYLALAASPENGRAKSGQRRGGQAMPRSSQIKLTPPGLVLITQVVYPLSQDGKANRFIPDLTLPAAPTWNAKLGELHWGPRLAIRFKRAAPNSIRLLVALQEHGWGAWAPNPFYRLDSKSAEQQLHEAIYNFNRSVMGKVIRLHSDGSRTGFRWERLI